MSRFVKEINDSPLAAERAEKDILGNKIDEYYSKLSLIAPQYSPKSTYVFDQLVFQEDTLYKCSVNCGPEEWNQYHWTEVNDLSDYIKNLQHINLIPYGSGKYSQVSSKKVNFATRGSGGRTYYAPMLQSGYGVYYFTYIDGRSLVTMTLSPDGGDGTWAVSSISIPQDFSSVIPSDATSSNKLVTTNTLDARLADFGGFKEVQGTGADLHPNVPSGEEDSKLIYLVRDNSATGDDKYKEWIWDSGDPEANPPVSAQWKLIGDTTMNLDGKADKVQNATAGNFASLDSSGNLNDSGNKAADFASAMHNHGNIASDGKSTSEPTSTTKFLRADGSWQVPERSDGHSVWYRNTSWTASQLMNQYVGKSTTWDNTDSYELKTLKAGDTIKIYVTVTNMANAHFVMDLKVTEVDSVAPTATVMAIYQADQNEVLDGTDADANNFIIPGNYILQNVTQVTKNWPGTSSGSLDFTNLCVTRLVRNDASSPFSASIDIQQSVRWSARQLYRTKVNGTWGLWKIIPMGNVNYYEAIGSSTQPVYVDTIGRLVACDDPWNYIKTKIYNGSLGSANRPVYWTGSNLALSKPSPNADLMGTVGNTTAAGARADTDQLENTTINCNNGSVRYLNAMKFISNVPYIFLIPSVNASKSALVTSTAMTVYQIGASSFSLGTNATFYLDKAGGTSAQHEIVFAYRVGTSLYIFHQY